MEDKPHGLKGRPSNAAKPPDQKAESFIHARCTSSDKAGWVKAAQSKGMKLTEWIVSVLNEAVKTNRKTYGSDNTKIRGYARKKVIGFGRGVDPVGPIMELKLECGHAVEFSREWRSDDEIPDQYLCDKCLK